MAEFAGDFLARVKPTGETWVRLAPTAVAKARESGKRRRGRGPPISPLPLNVFAPKRRRKGATTRGFKRSFLLSRRSIAGGCADQDGPPQARFVR